MTIATAPLLEGTLIAEQLANELESREAGVRRYRKLQAQSEARGDAASLKPLERMMLHWYEPLRQAIRSEQRSLRLDQTGSQNHADVLLAIDADTAAVITMHTAVGACILGLKEPFKRTELFYNIGIRVMAELNYRALDTDHGDRKKLDRSVRHMTARRVNRWAKRKLGDEAIVSRVTAASLGSCLFWLLFGVASSDDYDKPFAPAFVLERQICHSVKNPSVITLAPAVLAMFDYGHGVREVMRPRYGPMVCEPVPWMYDEKTGNTTPGGYLRLRSPIISKPTGEQTDAIRAAGAAMQPGYDALNAISSTRFRINRDILEVQRAMWETGGGDAGIPAADELPKPPVPDDFETNEAARTAWKREAVKVHRANVALTSDRVGFLLKLSIADKFANHDAIHFPHQFDFRYRGYPSTLYLHHQGDDVCRGLLEFADKRATADSEPAWRWLYIHAANCYGHDKLRFTDRWAWTNSHRKLIAASASSPLDNTEFWGKADKPWQFLAACMAIDDPAKAAHLPIQVDGTCNGLQHYAAMGLDEAGAAVVNLTPGDAPSDVYANVATTAHAIASSDADAGHPIAQRIVEHVTRSLVKQPVMTSVYGVTAVGAREQVQGKLHELGFKGEEAYAAADYLSRIVMASVGKVCSSATKIMAWVQKGARQIAADGKLVRWTNPMGMPVVQPYRRGKIIKVPSSAISFNLQVNGGAVRASRHASGSAPNFVHSIDAAHMMMTANACKKAGIAFAAVHDSYWTHAADMDTLARILREEFIRLHSVDQVDRLYREWQKNYPNITFDPPPARGNLDLNLVAESPYFFS